MTDIDKILNYLETEIKKSEEAFEAISNNKQLPEHLKVVLETQFMSIGQGYWNVKNFIEVNFIENKN